MFLLSFMFMCVYINNWMLFLSANRWSQKLWAHYHKLSIKFRQHYFLVSFVCSFVGGGLKKVASLNCCWIAYDGTTYVNDKYNAYNISLRFQFAVVLETKVHRVAQFLYQVFQVVPLERASQVTLDLIIFFNHVNGILFINHKTQHMNLTEGFWV